MVMAEEDCDRLLGDGKGEKIRNLLEGAMGERETGGVERDVGIKLWVPQEREEDAEGAMEGVQEGDEMLGEPQWDVLKGAWAEKGRIPSPRL